MVGATTCHACADMISRSRRRNPLLSAATQIYQATKIVHPKSVGLVWQKKREVDSFQKSRDNRISRCAEAADECVYRVSSPIRTDCRFRLHLAPNPPETRWSTHYFNTAETKLINVVTVSRHTMSVCSFPWLLLHTITVGSLDIYLPTPLRSLRSIFVVLLALYFVSRLVWYTVKSYDVFSSPPNPACEGLAPLAGETFPGTQSNTLPGAAVPVHQTHAEGLPLAQKLSRIRDPNPTYS